MKYKVFPLIKRKISLRWEIEVYEIIFEVNRNGILFRDLCNPAKSAIFPFSRSNAKADSRGHKVRHYYADIKFAANVWRGRCASIIFILERESAVANF